MRVLALDTTSDWCTCALIVDGEVMEKGSLAPRRHADLVLPLVAKLLAEAQLGLTGLDGIAFGRGPGSFTGVRIGTGVAQGLAFGADLPVAPVSSLRAIAQGVFRGLEHTKVAVALDARMAQVYWGCFTLADGQTMAPVGEERVCSPGRVPRLAGDGWFGAGGGWMRYRGLLRERVGDRCAAADSERCPRAFDVAILGAMALAAGDAVTAELALPVYLRDRVTAGPARAG